VLRYSALFLLTFFFLIGTGPFDRAHAAEVQRELDAIPAPRLPANSPLRKLPQRYPLHNPATCSVCIAIHSATTIDSSTPPTISPLSMLGRITLDPPSSLTPATLITEQSRAPPIL
jgi:hypothetical protein